MKLLYDEPIKIKKNDLFHRDGFVTEFVKNLLYIPEGKNIVFSINGEWGSGKTSLINMIKEELGIRINEKTDGGLKTCYKILDFAPWNIVDEKDIIMQFLRCISSGFAPNKVKKILESNKYKSTKKVVDCIPKINKAFKFVDKLLKNYSNSLLNGEKDLLENKEIICAKLNSIPFKFIVFIDDIDRLNNKEIILLIQLVKAVFDFPNIIYILSYDKRIVAKALSDEQGENGFEYLEKIIQVAIDIPKIDKKTIDDCLVKELQSLIDNRENIYIDKERWNKIYLNGCNEYFVTMRDMIRYINLISFKIDGYLEVIDCIDFFAIEAISLFEPDLLELIWINRYFLCECRYVKDIEGKTIEFKKEVEKISKNYKLIEKIFPVLSRKNTSDGQNGIVNQQIFFGRICRIEYLEFYFSSKLGNEFVSREEFNKITSMEKGKERVDLICKFSNHQFSSFLKMLCGFLEKNSELAFFSIIFDAIEAEKTYKNSDTLFNERNDSIISSMVKHFLEEHDVTTRMIILENLFLTNNNLCLLVALIYSLSSGTNAYSNVESLSNNLVSNDTVLFLHKMLSNRVNKYLLSEKIFSDTKIPDYLLFMNELNKDDLVKWFADIEKNGLTSKIISKCYKKRGVHIYGGTIERYFEYIYVFDKNEKYISDAEAEKIKNRLVDKEIEATIGEVLFLMPRKKREDENWYTIKDMKKYCSNNKIQFNSKDSFVE